MTVIGTAFLLTIGGAFARIHVEYEDLRASPLAHFVNPLTGQVGERIEPVTTLFNIWTHEALPILPGETQTLQSRFHVFLRDHFTNQATHMDTRLIGVLNQLTEDTLNILKP